jgi:phage regulator Rha-like protein
VADELPSIENISDRIRIIRGQRVMLDVDLARLFGVPTSRLNEQVKRNGSRFPTDFAFMLTGEEWRSAMLSQFATTLRRTRRLDRLPLAFTEHGCLMLANVLRSARAVEVSVLVVRAFVQMRSALTASAELAARVDELGREVERQGENLITHDQAIHELLAEIRRLTRFPEPALFQSTVAPRWRCDNGMAVLPHTRGVS